MGREADMEKEFLENIDQMLAGEEVKIGADVSDDYRAVLDFAQKLVRLRVIPSPSFKAQLKERLLQKLSEEETEALASAVTTTALVLALAVVGVVWHWGGLSTPPPAPVPVAPKGIPTPTSVPAPRPAKLIAMEATTEKSAYLPGEEITIEFSFKNITPDIFEIEPFPPEIEIMKAGPDDQTVCRFPAGTEAKSLEPDEVVTYTLTWDQSNDQGQQVDYGHYQFFIPGGGTLDDKGTVGGVFILPEEGVIERTINVNESQTVDGVTFLLERVELTTRGPRFYVFNADYSFPDKPPPEVYAAYRLDKEPVRESGPVNIVSGSSNLDGMEYVWWMSVPVPKSARVLTFVITRFGDMEGPWEFPIPLEP